MIPRAREAPGHSISYSVGFWGLAVQGEGFRFRAFGLKFGDLGFSSFGWFRGFMFGVSLFYRFGVSGKGFRDSGCGVLSLG